MDELSYDRFHTQEKDLFRVVENQYYSGQPVFPLAVTPGPLAEALKADYPEVELATRVHFGWNAFQYEDAQFEDRGIYSESVADCQWLVCRRGGYKGIGYKLK